MAMTTAHMKIPEKFTYFVEDADNIWELMECVAQRMSQGWQVVGGPSDHRGRLIQALVRPNALGQT